MIKNLADWRRSRKETDELDAKLRARRPKAKPSPAAVRDALATVERIAAESGVRNGAGAHEQRVETRGSRDFPAESTPTWRVREILGSR